MNTLPSSDVLVIWLGFADEFLRILLVVAIVATFAYLLHDLARRG